MSDQQEVETRVLLAALQERQAVETQLQAEMTVVRQELKAEKMQLALQSVWRI